MTFLLTEVSLSICYLGVNSDNESETINICQP